MLQMLRAMEAASGTTIPYEIAPRRPGTKWASVSWMGLEWLQGILPRLMPIQHVPTKNLIGMQSLVWRPSVRMLGDGK